MVDVFEDQAKFMKACDQTVGQLNFNQLDLYYRLINEEVGELNQNPEDLVEQLDALIDIMVVTVGALHSMGVNAEAAWKEVMRSNFAKIDPITGKVRKREDGKVLKPDDWRPPRLESCFRKPINDKQS